MESLSGERRSPDTMAPALVGIIGGSALGDAFELEEEQARFLVTPHGAPSDPPRVGVHAGVPVAFLPRHGKDHRIPPHKLNHRANLWALKEIGATHVIGTSSTGIEGCTCRQRARGSRRGLRSRSSSRSVTSSG